MKDIFVTFASTVPIDPTDLHIKMLKAIPQKKVFSSPPRLPPLFSSKLARLRLQSDEAETAIGFAQERQLIRLAKCNFLTQRIPHLIRLFSNLLQKCLLSVQSPVLKYRWSFNTSGRITFCMGLHEQGKIL